MKAGDVVVIARETDGAPFLARLLGREGGSWRLVDARGIVWRRLSETIAPVAGDDPRLGAFLSAEARRR